MGKKFGKDFWWCFAPLEKLPKFDENLRFFPPILEAIRTFVYPCPSDYQPILGFACPLIREILVKILNFITYRAGGGRRVKMGKYFLKTASGSGSNITQGQLQITLIFETSREIKKSYEHLQKLYS